MDTGETLQGGADNHKGGRKVKGETCHRRIKQEIRKPQTQTNRCYTTMQGGSYPANCPFNSIHD